MTPRLQSYLAERERSVPPPKRYQRRKVGHARPFTSRLEWMQAWRRRGA